MKRWLGTGIDAPTVLPVYFRTPSTATSMPKVLVLFSSRADLARIADAVTAGAESVKFTEVELRRLDDPAADASGGTKHRKLESPEAITGYDALVVGVSRESASEVRALLERGAGSAKGALVDKVLATFSATAASAAEETASILAPLLRQGMILVGAADGDVRDAGSDLETARRLGARVAKVAEWIRHARSHEHHHSHSH